MHISSFLFLFVPYILKQFCGYSAWAVPTFPQHVLRCEFIELPLHTAMVMASMPGQLMHCLTYSMQEVKTPCGKFNAPLDKYVSVGLKIMSWSSTLETFLLYFFIQAAAPHVISISFFLHFFAFQKCFNPPFCSTCIKSSYVAHGLWWLERRNRQIHSV